MDPEELEFGREEDNGKGNFYALLEGKRVGEIPYSRPNPRLLTIDYMYVEPAHRGKGISSLLLERAVDFARQENLQVRPICSVAARVLKATPEYHDVLQR